jgi:hypothetical protein
MEINELQHYMQKLPASYQSQVLDFVEYLVAKAEREAARVEETAWSYDSLGCAMRGMEQEDTPTYTLDDIKVSFQ